MTVEVASREMEAAAALGMDRVRLALDGDEGPELAEHFRGEGVHCWTVSVRGASGRVESLWAWWKVG